MAGRLVCDFESLEDGVHHPVSVQTPTTCLGFGDEKNLGVCKINERPGQFCEDNQAGATLMGPVSSMGFVARSCGCNAHNAMCNRHGAKRPPVTRSLIPFQKLLSEHIPSTALCYVEHFTEFGRDWINKWPLCKRAAIVHSQTYDPCEPGKVKNMVKREVYPKLPTKARCIQFYPNLRTQAEYAPEFTSLQKAWGKTMNRAQFGSCKVTFASGMNAEDLGLWMDNVLTDYRDPWFYERDGKNWDSTMGPEHQAVKDQAYYLAGESLCDFAHACAIVRGTGRYPNGKLKYTLEYTTKSGHNDTTLGNNIANAAVTVTAFQGLTCDILVAGDDLLVVVEGDYDFDEILGRENELGIKPEARKFHNIEETSFISGSFAIDDERKIAFVPKPGRLLTRLMWTVHPPAPKQVKGYLRGVALGLLPTVGGMPVIGAWLRCYDDEEIKIVELGKQWKKWMFGDTKTAPRLKGWFRRRYGLDDREVEELENTLILNAYNRCFVKSPALRRIIHVDTCGLDEREVGL